MMSLLSQIVFMQPILLTALLALPFLWYLLRITPPAPRTIVFPATQFLLGLSSTEKTPSKVPWWILLIRLILAALIILALARPVINPADELPGRGAFRLVIDNSWASAQSWDLQIRAAEEAATQAGREQREIYIVPTTPAIGETKIEQYGPLSSGDALSIIRGMTPNPWPANYSEVAKYLDENKGKNSIHTSWLSHGLDEGNMNDLIEVLQRHGGLNYISPSPEQLPLLLRPTKVNQDRKQRKRSQRENSDVSIDIDAPKNIDPNLAVNIQAKAADGDIIDAQNVELNESKYPHTVFFDVLDGLKNKIVRFTINSRKGAGSIFLLDDQYKKRKVGIAAPAQKDVSAPLIEDSYYIKRALEPFSDISSGDIASLIQKQLSVLILSDVGAMPTDTLNNLEKWVKDGGLLLRFSGPNMAKAQGENFLLPVTLRAGERSLSGALSWDKPQKIAEFEESSPFYGLEIPDDITVKQQVLADPSQDLENKVWARLEDGTPFITAKSVGKGSIVLIHTSANTDWSDFALSGLYVSVLKRVVQLSGSNASSRQHNFTALDPVLIMDGYGNLVSPPASITPIPTTNLAKKVPSSLHPPGLYGRSSFQYALNIGTNLPALRAPGTMPISVIQGHYDTKYEIDIMPAILSAALVFFIIDWAVMILLVGQGFRLIPRFTKPAAIGLVLVYLLTPAAPAFADDQSDIKYSTDFYLAYIVTGDSNTDNISQRGLEELAEVLSRRTSVEPAGVIGLNPERDSLTLFPLIYWPISSQQRNISDQGIKNIQYYLDHGGTILFDTRDQNRSTGAITNTENAKALRSVTSSLNVPPVAPISDDHVLGRAFYLLDEYPGHYSSGVLWVEKNSSSGRDNVSSILIGSNDWARAWANSAGADPYHRYQSDPSSRQQELSLRFGINLVMYALTGNYKADQVHIPHILKRLGE